MLFSSFLISGRSYLNLSIVLCCYLPQRPKGAKGVGELFICLFGDLFMYHYWIVIVYRKGAKVVGSIVFCRVSRNSSHRNHSKP
jgi:hypothetical protein